MMTAAGCYTQQHVVSYTQADKIETNPSLIIYECVRLVDDVLPQQYISYPLEDGKNFTVYVLDGARRDFANNIAIDSIQ